MKKTELRDMNHFFLLDETTPFAIRESFNMLRTNLMYSMKKSTDGCPVFAAASCREGAGKSTIFANLSVSFTHLDKKILLIDGDMRCPTLHDYFGVDKRHVGLSELISGIADDVLIPSVLPGLDLITGGRIPPNPSELITSPRFLELLHQWRQEYDVIFIDFPPIGIVTDALAICQQITGYIFCVRSGRTSAKSINAAIESMERLGAKIVGVVLNDYNMKKVKGHRYAYAKYVSYNRYRKDHTANIDRKDSSAK